MNPFIRHLAAQRRKFLDGLDANEGDINLDIFEDFYPDQAHFIYELLQNAEDAGAKKAMFKLGDKCCLFEHDGKPFTEDDVRNITGIHNSAKDKRPDQIGQFGIGFKSVFAYTLAPEIGSGKFAFKITRFVLPECIDADPSLGTSTRFKLPFNHPKKPAREAYSEIEAALDSLPETTLLFLSNLKVIRWKVNDAPPVELERLRYRKNHVEVKKKLNGTMATSSHFLLFDEPVDGLQRKRLAVAFTLDFLPNVQSFNPKRALAKQMRIVPASPERVAVYFPAEKEKSGLRFHLHAPFVPELSRASIKETPANDPLFQQLARLTAKALAEIKNLGLLKAGFLEVLPNPQDDLGRYKCIREAIIDEMNNTPLTPTYSGGHEPAKRLRQARASLKELLSEADIAHLLGYAEGATDSPKWAIGATQKSPRIDHFLDGLAICKWDVREFIERLIACTTEGHSQTPNAQFDDWLGKKAPGWHQQLYSLLSDHLSRCGYWRPERIKSCRIVRVSDGSYGTGPSCFFPDDAVEHDEELPRVARLVYTSGDDEQQQKAARKFLEDVGVRDVDEAVQVERILQKRYTGEDIDPRDQDLERFIAVVEKEPRRSKLFAEYPIFEGRDGMWWQPNDLFLDTPFLDTGLSAYYDALGDSSPRAALASRYEKCGIPLERLAAFAKAVGVHTVLRVIQSPCHSNLSWADLCSGDEVKSNNDSYRRIDRDFDVAEFEKLTAFQTVAASKLVWLTMVNLVKPEQLTAQYQRNNYSERREAPSRLVQRLVEAEWVPQTGGRFVRPSEASRALLPKGIPFDEGYEWLSKVHFGEAVQQVVEDAQTNEAAAKKMGFPDAESLERAKQFAALPRIEQERVLAEIQRRRSHRLPEHEPRDPKRRAERVRRQATEARDRAADERTRSVSTGRDDVKKQAAPYLEEQYTVDGEMFCQVCKTPLPFRLNDGSWFFEKVEFLLDLAKLHHQNFLALCPNHAAMFQHANGSKDSLQSMLLRLEGNALDVVLAQQRMTIYFTKTHIADLRAVIDAEQAG